MRIRSGWLCVLLATPLSMAVELPDSTTPEQTTSEFTTSFRAGGGGGRYYHTLGFSDCGTSVPVKQDFVDFGAEIDRQANKTSHFGLRGGFIHDTTDTLTDISALEGQLGSNVDRTRDVYYGNLYGAREWKSVGFGLGVLMTSKPLSIHNPQDPTDDEFHIYPTGHLRFGDPSRFYVSGHLFEGVPLYSGGGVFYVGAGGRPVPSLELYGGYFASGPYREEGWVGRINYDLNRHWTLGTVVRFPSSYQNYDEKEYGVSASLMYRTFRSGSE